MQFCLLGMDAYWRAYSELSETLISLGYSLQKNLHLAWGPRKGKDFGIVIKGKKKEKHGIWEANGGQHQRNEE